MALPSANPVPTVTGLTCRRVPGIDAARRNRTEHPSAGRAVRAETRTVQGNGWCGGGEPPHRGAIRWWAGPVEYAAKGKPIRTTRAGSLVGRDAGTPPTGTRTSRETSNEERTEGERTAREGEIRIGREGVAIMASPRNVTGVLGGREAALPIVRDVIDVVGFDHCDSVPAARPAGFLDLNHIVTPCGVLDDQRSLALARRAGFVDRVSIGFESRPEIPEIRRRVGVAGVAVDRTGKISLRSSGIERIAGHQGTDGAITCGCDFGGPG